MSGRHLGGVCQVPGVHLPQGAFDARGVVLNRKCAQTVHMFAYVGRLASLTAGRR